MSNLQALDNFLITPQKKYFQTPNLTFRTSVKNIYFGTSILNFCDFETIMASTFFQFLKLESVYSD